MQLVNREMLNSLYKRDRLEYFLNGEILRVNEMNGDIGNLDYQNYPVVLNTIYEMFQSGRYPNVEKMFEDKLFLLLEKRNYLGKTNKINIYSAMNLIYLQLKNEQNGKALFQLKRTAELLEKLRDTIRENKADLQSFTTQMGTNMYEDLVRLNKEMVENHIPSVIDENADMWEPWGCV